MAALFPLVFAVLLPAVFLRIAAPIARVVISWRLALSFGLIVAIIAALERALLSRWVVVVPVAVAALVGAAIYLAVGTWFFSSRGTARAGGPLGRQGAFKFMLLYLVIAAAFLGFTAGVQHFRPHGP